MPMPRRYFVKMARQKNIVQLSGEYAMKGLIYVNDNLAYLRAPVEANQSLGYFAPRGKYCANIAAIKVMKKNAKYFVSSNDTGEAIFFSYEQECHWSVYMMWTNIYSQANCYLDEGTQILATKRLEADFFNPKVLVCFCTTFSLYLAQPIQTLFDGSQPAQPTEMEEERCDDIIYDLNTLEMLYLPEVKEEFPPMEELAFDPWNDDYFLDAPSPSPNWQCTCLLDQGTCFSCPFT